MSKLLLDVGCGGSLLRKNGYESIGLDLFRDFTPQAGDQKSLIKINKGELFIQASAEYLPFKNNSIDFVYSSHVIEHVHKPDLMLKELYRVSKSKIFIRCPHRLGELQNFPYHIHALDEEWFKKHLKGKNYKIVVTKRSYIEKLLALLIYKLRLRKHPNFNPIQLFLMKLKINEKIMINLLKILNLFGLPREIIVVINK